MDNFDDKKQTAHYLNKLNYEIDSWDLKAALDQRENIVVIDVRAATRYCAGHIPRAINIPHRAMTTDSTRSFDRSVTYVVYCDGIGCNASTKGALNLSKLGFKTKELIGGLDWWKRDGYLVVTVI